MDLDRLFANLTPEDVQRLLSQGEGPQIEFKVSIRSVLDIARLASAFANTEGGVLLVGVSENPLRIVGIDPRQLSPLVADLHKRIRPLPPYQMHLVEMPDQMKVAAIVVKPVRNEVVVSDAGPYLRIADQMRPMTPQEIQQRLPTPPEPVTNQHIAESIAAMASDLESLHQDLKIAQSLKGQLPTLVAGFALGIVASVIASYIFLALNPAPPSTPPALTVPQGSR